MDWFERITGFKEASYLDTQAKLRVEDGRLLNQATGQGWSMGVLETPTLAELREPTAAASQASGRLTVSTQQGDVRALHAAPEASHALFQVASQFNLLEMVGPGVSPEAGVTRYASDATQGPACAIACGAGTIYRNYLVPIGGQRGQTSARQIDTLHDIGAALGNAEGRLWSMRNGYALCTEGGLQEIDRRLAASSDEDLDLLRGLLRVGLHREADVTDPTAPGQRVTQVYCSALPVAYSNLPAPRWARFGTLVLEAAYEATLRAALLNNAQHGTRPVYLTHLGGGAFGNRKEWIRAAMLRALQRLRGCRLDVRIVSYGTPDGDLLEFVGQVNRAISEGGSPSEPALRYCAAACGFKDRR